MSIKLVNFRALKCSHCSWLRSHSENDITTTQKKCEYSVNCAQVRVCLCEYVIVVNTVVKWISFILLAK